MGVVVVNPDGPLLNTGTVYGGPATAWEALSDASDATGVELSVGEKVGVTFANPVIPAGAKVKDVQVLMRYSALGPVQARGIIGLDTFYTRSMHLADTVEQGVGQVVAAIAQGDYEANLNTANWQVILDSASLGGWGQLLLVTTAVLVVNYVDKPVVAVTAPSGLLDEDNRPTVRWSNTLDGAGGPQFSYAAKIFNAAQYGAGGFDPDTSEPFVETSAFSSANSWRVPQPLPDDDYRVYVRVVQVYSEVSDWDSEDFEINVDVPAVPTLAATAEDEHGRVLLELTDPGGADVAASGFEIQSDRADPDIAAGDEEGNWEKVRTDGGDGQSFDVPASVYDFESPNGEVRYRARAFHEFASGTVSYSDWVEDSAFPRSEWWLKHPYDPRLNIEVEMVSFAGWEREGRKTTVQPLNRPDPVSISDVRGAQTGELVIEARTDFDAEQVAALASSQSPVRLEAKLNHHEPSRWIVLDDESVSRVIDNAHRERRRITYSWTEVARPPGELEVVSNLYDYDELVLEIDRASLYWKLDDAGGANTVVEDASGFDRHGKIYDGQVVATTGVSLGFWVPLRRGSVHSALILGNWNDPPTVQDHPGAGIKADDYKPFVPGSRRCFEMWFTKSEDESFQTIFSSDLGDKPDSVIGAGGVGSGIVFVGSGSIADFPTVGNDLRIGGVVYSYTSKVDTGAPAGFYGVKVLSTGQSIAPGAHAVGAAITYGVGAPHPTWEMGADGMMRMYPDVNRFPTEWVDWGTPNTGHPNTDFDYPSGKPHHLVCNYDDTDRIAEWIVNGVSQGKQDAGDSFAAAWHGYSALAHLGNLQVGWRGGPPFFPNPGNTEVIAGFVDSIAVYEHLLSAGEAKRHYIAGKLPGN